MKAIKIRLVSKKKDIEAVYRLRYKVYCASPQEERPSDFRPEDYPDGKEFDPWDKYSVHFAAFMGKEVVGCLRLIADGPHGFLMETAFRLPPELDRGKGLEASRMTVDYRIRNSGMVQRVCRVAAEWSIKNGYTWWCVAMQTFLLPSFYRAGWRIREIGEPALYHNILAQPIIVYLEREER